MKGRLLEQTGGNETEKVMINKLSPYKLILSLQNRFHADNVNFSILLIYFIVLQSLQSVGIAGHGEIFNV